MVQQVPNYTILSRGHLLFFQSYDSEVERFDTFSLNLPKKKTQETTKMKLK